jgi:hypothetical protein
VLERLTSVAEGLTPDGLTVHNPRLVSKSLAWLNDDYGFGEKPRGIGSNWTRSADKKC